MHPCVASMTTAMVARRFIDLAAAGERDPERLTAAKALAK
jgi:hypothetical protein